jgi:hypothetical protein
MLGVSFTAAVTTAVSAASVLQSRRLLHRAAVGQHPKQRTCVIRKAFMLRRLPSHTFGCKYSKYWWYCMIGGSVHTFAPVRQL